MKVWQETLIFILIFILIGSIILFSLYKVNEENDNKCEEAARIDYRLNEVECVSIIFLKKECTCFEVDCGDYSCEKIRRLEFTLK